MQFKQLSVFIFLSLIISCTVYQEYPIEVYKPEEFKISEGAKSTLIAYRGFKFPEDTLSAFYKSDYRLIKSKEKPPYSDSLIVTACLKELTAQLYNHNLFDDIKILPYRTFNIHSDDHMSPLPGEILEKITKNSNAQLLIMLDTYSSFFSRYSETVESPLTHEVITVAVWSIYDPIKKVCLDRKSMIDTVYWNGFDNEGNYIQGYTPPSRKAALEMAAAIAGSSFSKRFHPTWEQVTRVLSVPPLPDFNEATTQFREGEIDKAIEIWRQYSGERDGKMAIHARFNLALAFELKDDLDSALKWVSAARDLADKFKSRQDIKMISDYQKLLEKRLIQLQSL